MGFTEKTQNPYSCGFPGDLTGRKNRIFQKKPGASEFTLMLPYPPTGNHAVKHFRGGHYLTNDVRTYRQAVASIVRQSAADDWIDLPIRIVAEIRPPDRRRRDMDNAWKTIADALTHAGVWKDDCQIADLRLLRGEPVAGGSVTVTVETL